MPVVIDRHLLPRFHFLQVLRSCRQQIDVQVQKCDILVSVAAQHDSAVHASKGLARSVTWAAAKAPDVSFQPVTGYLVTQQGGLGGAVVVRGIFAFLSAALTL